MVSTCSIPQRLTQRGSPRLKCEIGLLSLESTEADCKERGRVIKELGFRRTDLIITTKLYWGLRTGPNDGGLSRKQSVSFALVHGGC